MRILNAVCALAMVLGPVGGAAASPREIPVRAGAKYSHKPTKIALPAAIGGLSRDRIAALDVDEVDVMVDYRSADGADVTTIYLYRNAVGDVPLWFDRASEVIENNPTKYGKVTPVVPAAAFVPPRQSAASGLRVVYSISGDGWISTALAVLPVGDFYVKLRLSSARRTPAQLETLLHETLSAISWPGRLAPGPAAVPIAACDFPLEFAGEAKRAPRDGAAALMGAVMPSVVDALAKSGKSRATPVRYCRDPRAIQNAGLYRPNGDKERYLIAFQDAGRALQVGRNDLNALLDAKEGQPESTRYSLDLILLSENRGYGDFLSLPPPEQAIAVVESTNPIYTTSTVGKKTNISIAEDALGDE